MTPRTILHTIETTGIGGAESVLLNVASHLDPRRFRSIALLTAGGLLRDALEARGVRTFLVAARHWWDLRMPVALSRLCRAERVAVIHAHLPDHNFHACLASRLVGCPVVATYHGPVEFWNARSLRGALKLRVVRSGAASVVAVCDVVRDLLRRHAFPESRLHRIYNGVDVDAFQSARRADLRAELGWPAHTRLVGTVANVRVSKGYEIFVRAARRLLDADPTLRFVAAGDIDPALGAPILRLVEELGLARHVAFLGYRPDIARILRDLDVFVLASTSEGFPLVLLEAMAADAAVVATRCGGPQELIEDGWNGYLVPVGDAAALSERVHHILADQPAAALLRAHARATVMGFTIESMVEDYQNLYTRLLTPGRGGALRRARDVVAQPA